MTRFLPPLRLVASTGVVAIVTAAPPAVAAPAAAPVPAAAPAPADTAVDVTIPETPPPERSVVVEFNPLALIVGKLSADVVVVPGDHHALVLSPFYAWDTTHSIDVYDNQGDATQLPQQKFSGFGGEIGYRYYTGLGGPRGFFAGPSLILASMTATAQDGGRTPYLDYGFALDVGYEMIVVDSLALSLGAGVQYTTPDKSIPDQQFPADVYANSRVFPRALASIGWAF